MRPALGLGIDPSHPLGQRVFALLTRAHVPHVYERKLGLPYARVLLVNPSALPAMDADLVCVLTPSASSAQPSLRALEPNSSNSSRVAWLAHGPSMASLNARLRLALKTGRFLSSASELAAAYVSEDDVALAVAASLASDEIPAGFHVIHGSESLSHRHVVRLASEVWTQPIALEDVALDDLERGLIERGMSAAEARAARDADSALLQGGWSAPSDTFARLTGMNPLRLLRYLEEQHLAWSDPALAGAAPASTTTTSSIPSASTQVRVVLPPGLAAREVGGVASLRVSA
ncbi:MAG: hypothetical protein QM778_03650 [Myxococcales bacterium]